MRPSLPVRHFWPLRNQRFFCSRLRPALLVERVWNADPLNSFSLWPPCRSYWNRTLRRPRSGTACVPIRLDACRCNPVPLKIRISSRSPMNKTDASRPERCEPDRGEHSMLFGPPPLLDGEDTEIYDQLMRKIFTAVTPADIFEEI